MIEKHTIKTRFGELSYYDLGEKKGATILFVHGNSVSSEVFYKQFVAELCSTARLIALDLPGHGDSAIPPDRRQAYSYVGYAQAVSELTEKLNLTNIIVVGASLGGHASIELVNPQHKFNQLHRVIGLVLTGAPPINLATDESRKLGFKYNNTVLSLIQKDTLTQAEAESLVKSSGLNIDSTTEKIVAHAKNMDGVARRMMQESKEIAAMRKINQVENIKQTRLPVMFVMGAEDEGINNKYILQQVASNCDYRMSRHLPPHQVLELQTGHAPFFEQAELFNRYLMQFVEHCRELS